MNEFRFTTFQIIAASFLALILVGAFLLMLPISSRTEGSASFSDCLFTATSAVCVTGLVVRDTAVYWTPFGQMIIMILIQIGGLGVITAALSIIYFSGGKITLMQRITMQESIAAPQIGGITQLAKFIVITAFLIEAFGMLLLFPVFFHDFGFLRGVWYSVFHSVSAFCNAGFDLMGHQGEFSSVTGYSQNVLINLALIILITLGGIGFLVCNDIQIHRFSFRHYRLQSKIVITVSAFLILIPFLWFFFFELDNLPVHQRILPSLLQSVTLRTAGFNSIDLAKTSGGGRALMILCMLIGGSPGSTAGGMKTTTIAVLLLTTIAVFSRKDEVECFGRRVSSDIIRNAVAIFVMYFVLFFVGAITISRIESLPLLTCLFETASALGTVGLTLGITSELGHVSRVILIVLMFMGRVGGLTLIYAAHSARNRDYNKFPLEKIAVG